MRITVLKVLTLVTVSTYALGCGRKEDNFEGVATYTAQLMMRSNGPMKQVLYFKGSKVKGEVAAGTPMASYFLADYTKDSVQYFHPPQDMRMLKISKPLETGDTLLKYLGKDETIGKFHTKIYEAPIRTGLRVRMYLTKDLPEEERSAIEKSLSIGTTQSSDNQTRINAQVRRLDMVPIRIQVLQDTAKLMETNFVSIEAQSIPDSIFSMPRTPNTGRQQLP